MTRADALRDMRTAFAEAGLDTSALDARLLLRGALGIAAAALIAHLDEPLTSEEAEAVAAFKERRLAHEPVARILGEAEFWGLPFALSKETLVPRSDTEIVVASVLRLLPERNIPLRILDLGTGTGCLLTALLHEWKKATGLGIDRSLNAVRTAQSNARRNGVGERALFVQSDWAAAIQGPFDLIVSNPPYIASRVIPTLDPDVREYDPLPALDGGVDGLDAYRIILADAPRLLRRGGHLFLEIGFDQGEAVRNLAAPGPLEFSGIQPDLTGHPRCAVLMRA